MKKVIGILLLYIFACNGLFVILQEKKTWFEIYSTFKYLKKYNPKFESGGKVFLYAGALVNCWAVMFCTIASYAIVGASSSFKDLMFDALGLLFLYNLDDIGGVLGFVYEDDWDGVRLGWIYNEMVKKDWHPKVRRSLDSRSVGEASDDSDQGSEPNDDDIDAPTVKRSAHELLEAAERSTRVAARRIDEDPDYAPCVKRCGRRSAKGFDTCCRACGRNEAPPHDEDCEKQVQELIAQDEEFVGGKHAQWGVGGHVINWMFKITLSGITIFTIVAPLVTIGTPFTIIAPD